MTLPPWAPPAGGNLVVRRSVSHSGLEVPFRLEASRQVALVGEHHTPDPVIEKRARSPCPEKCSERTASIKILSVTRSSTSLIVEVSGNEPFLPAPEATEVPGPLVKLI